MLNKRDGSSRSIATQLQRRHHPFKPRLPAMSDLERLKPGTSCEVACLMERGRRFPCTWP